MKVYLSGGMHGDWQDLIKDLYPEVEFFDPRVHNLSNPADYTKWDMDHIERSDAVIAYLSKDNPSGVGLAFEVGYALGLGKPVYFVNLTDNRYFAIVNHAVTRSFNTVDDMVTDFILLGGIPT